MKLESPGESLRQLRDVIFLILTECSMLERADFDLFGTNYDKTGGRICLALGKNYLDVLFCARLYRKREELRRSIRMIDCWRIVDEVEDKERANQIECWPFSKPDYDTANLEQKVQQMTDLLKGTIFEHF